MKKYKSNFYHGIMFHHFHDNKKHFPSQGSINANQFEKIIKLVGKDNILNPKDFINKLNNKSLKKNHVCLTFDDGLKSQFDIAYPILKKFNIKKFFFIYSSIFTKKPDLLEIFRYFRTEYYKNIDHFYKEFFLFCSPKIFNFLKKNEMEIKRIKKQINFYSINDIKFRLIRDQFISKKTYNEIMKKMFKSKNFKINSVLKKLFLNKKDLKKLLNDGHEIGLHSHSHPTKISHLSFKKQFKEYKINKNYLQNKIDKNFNKVISMSHPCGDYNTNTLKILKKMEIEIGFRQMMKKNNKFKNYKINQSNFEIAREDHSNIVRKFQI